MTVKLVDVAHATGFSVPTVSRVLSNSHYPVNAETKKIIQETAESMGYKPNLSARSLRTDRSQTIGIIVDDLLSPFTPPIVRGIQDYLSSQEYLSLIVNSDWNPDIEQEAVRNLLSRPVDGIIFVEYSHLADTQILERANKRHVFVHRLFGTPARNSIVPDDFYGATLAVHHLVALGHKRIAYINGPERWHNSQKRFAGYRTGLATNHIALDRELIQPGDWEFEGGYKAAQHLFKLSQRPTAIFAANDLMALGVVHAAQDLGLRTPQDIAVVGYDNRDFTKIVRPRLTTVSMPVYEMGWAAAELLLQQILNYQGDEDEVKIQGRIIIRETCGAEEAQKTQEMTPATMIRRVLLNKDPDR
ncbi:MAG TPA: LacI family DNA-binding transcriptional regulator [Levilinea sp.]|nr:LacI family DNA-binding transcriptional regulator [Levilinea sp.]